MKLQVPFLQLPIHFDSQALADEIAGIEEHHWRPHVAGLAGNSALTLVTAGGDPANDDLTGEMRPTPLLARLPRVAQVLDALGATWGRSRLMRLSGQAEVTPHVDTNYYWRERMRVHVPITTTPDVRFQVAQSEVNMRAGECWIFDTWSRHRVLNGNDSERIHLVADTVGGDRLWSLIAGGRPPGRDLPGWRETPHAFRADLPAPALDFEAVNQPVVMSPWEMRDHFVFLLAEAVPHPRLPAVQQGLLDLARRWQALWSAYGERREGWPRYRALLDRGRAEASARGAGEIGLRNEVGLQFMLDNYVFGVALADRADAGANRDVHGGSEAAAAKPRPAAPARHFDRPVFIVSPPRSGSTLLFETLVAAPGVYTIGDESHQLIEGIAALAPSAKEHGSNRLLAKDADPDVVQALRDRFMAALHDRDGRPPSEGAVRMLEKTPKNTLRIPFLREVFPGARFIYLHRDPRQVLASMIEGWRSGDFVTYPRLPGWNGPAWSFLLPPGWPAWDGLPLPDLVARQWEACMRILLDDLAAVPASDRIGLDYADLVADPQAQVQRLCGWADWRWDRSLANGLPLSRYTLTPPDPGKWQRHAADIEPALARLKSLVDRAKSAAAA
ncbi:sulfotransferase [Arenimonas sp. MALMAid1274]|uniref:sulfotransferase n=1 Tax=Arenimonas sp. MALMAid1274 TaxID=3411630 RepID=UPI003BA03011